MNKQTLILILVILIATVLRFYQLGEVPPSPDWDEASIGYNAYSLLKTGKDEYGEPFPLSIRSFNDYKPPLYTYLTVPSVAIFGLNTWAVRLPSAIAGVLAVLGVFVLAKKLFDRSSVPLISTLLLAVSPWHIQFSRVAFEANLGVTLHIWTAALFLMGLSQARYFVGSAVMAGLAMYSYHSERFFIPTLLLIMASIWRKQVFSKEKRRLLVITVVVGLIVVLPFVITIFDKSAIARLGGTSIFANQVNILKKSGLRLEYDAKIGNPLGIIFDNRRIENVKTLVSGYLAHFSPKWLFVAGDHHRHHAPDTGLLYLIELPFIIIGIFKLLQRAGVNRTFILAWLLVAPVAAATTQDVPHAVRTLTFLPVFQLLAAIGIASVLPKLSRLFKIVLVIVALGSFTYYVDMYFVHQNREYSQYWQYGYKELFHFTEEAKKDYDRIVVSPTLEQPYIFYLFFTRADPGQYQLLGGSHIIDKYEFRLIDWPNEKKDGRTLYVGKPGELGAQIQHTIYYLDGTPAIIATDKE